jgi:MFS family permease
VSRYLRSTFESLYVRDYRLYFAGQGISVIGNWVQKVAQAWLVLELTGSGTLLGVTVGLQQLPTLLLTPWGGLLADRLDRRRLLLWTQSAAVVPALALGALTALGQVTVWLVMALALALGVVEAVDKPARHTFVADLVGREHLVNAVALNNIMLNTGKVIGPAVAGVLISTAGVAVAFLLNALSYAAVVAVLLLIPTRQRQAVPRVRGQGQLREGARYAARTPAVAAPLALMTVTGLLAYEWTVTIPLFAVETFDGDADLVGLFFSAMGAGAIVGGLALAGALRASPLRMVTSGLLFSGVLLVTSLAPNVVLALIALFLLGAVGVAFRSLATSVVQLYSDPEMRGRTVALLIVAVGGTTPIGAPLLGWLSDQFGARVGLATGAVGAALAGVWALLYLRSRSVLDLPEEHRETEHRETEHRRTEARTRPVGTAEELTG